MNDQMNSVLNRYEAFKKGDVNAGTSAIAFLVWYCVSDIDDTDSSCAVPHSEY